MAHCYDVGRERCSASDRFLLDTNVVVGLVGRTTDARATAYAPYSAFVERARRAGARLFVSTLTLLELAGVAEKTQFARDVGRASGPGDLKQYRGEAGARARVVAETARMWSETSSFAAFLDAHVAASSAPQLIAALGASRLDGIDAALVLEARRAGISTIVTHDADYGSAPELIVLSANRAMLDA